MPLMGKDIKSSRDLFLDVNESTLSINFKSSGLLVPLLETIDLYERIKPSETIWYVKLMPNWFSFITSNPAFFFIYLYRFPGVLDNFLQVHR